MPITYHNADSSFRLLNKRKYKAFIEAQVKKASGKTVVLTYVFCSDEYLLNINRQFLQHDFYTDIITFDLSAGPQPIGGTEGAALARAKIEGEIYISIDRVKDNAEKLGVDFKEEISRVMFHGVLHLLGLKDKTKAQQKAMRHAEDEWLKRFKAFLKKHK